MSNTENKYTKYQYIIQIKFEIIKILSILFGNF